MYEVGEASLRRLAMRRVAVMNPWARRAVYAVALVVAVAVVLTVATWLVTQL